MKRIILPIGLALSIGLVPIETAAAPFDGFPGIPCDALDSTGGEDQIGLWLHGFLSGVNWVDPQQSDRQLASIAAVKERALQICADSPDGEITGSVLNRLYDVSSSN